VIVCKQDLNCHLRNSRKLKALVNEEMVPACRALSLHVLVVTWALLGLQLTPCRKGNIH
jgi:hypothetical protein